MLLIPGCQDGRYGTDCNETCTAHCKDGAVCDKQNGSCPSGQCSTGYQRSKCDQGGYILIASCPKKGNENTPNGEIYMLFLQQPLILSTLVILLTLFQRP